MRWARLARTLPRPSPYCLVLLTSSDAQFGVGRRLGIGRRSTRPGEIAAKTLPVLTAGLKNPLPLGPQGAAEGLGSLGPAAKDAVPALQQCLKDEDKAVRAAAAKAIELIGGAAGPTEVTRPVV